MCIYTGVHSYVCEYMVNSIVRKIYRKQKRKKNWSSRVLDLRCLQNRTIYRAIINTYSIFVNIYCTKLKNLPMNSRPLSFQVPVFVTNILLGHTLWWCTCGERKSRASAICKTRYLKSKIKKKKFTNKTLSFWKMCITLIIIW